ncbi:ecdysteroid 22-kinase family protein [Williamsia deligens]|uniref:Phosphotransferase n=1 Tax=Williamsia deligens TaxID=321325 RepID=A0ABW3G5P3_9NOCA|nr:ecdysteroid 22-kinase family protein [Williamsia deligens]MCP2193722.1 Phosphotransferase enzyme family protein [Williamsia deligens]
MPGWWSPDDIDADWVRVVLGIGDATAWRAERVTEGRPTMTARLHISRTDGSSTSVVLKCVDPAYTGPSDPLSREYRFHVCSGDLPIPTARCLAHRFDEGTRRFWLVFDDVGPGHYGDDLVGPTFTAGFLAITSLATVHRASGAAAQRPEWIDPLPVPDRASLGADYVRFVQRYGERIDPVHLSIANQVVAAIGTLTDHAGRLGARTGIVHGDLRYGNVLVGTREAGRPVVLTNWGQVSWGPCAVDLASFLALSSPPDTRRQTYDEILRHYQLAMGGAASSDDVDALRREIHDHAFLVLVQVIRCAVQTPGWGLQQRGHPSDLWLTLFARACTFLDDLGRPPASAASARPAGSAHPGDEFAHPDAVTDGRSEEWTLAVADVDAGVGAWFRFGRHSGITEGAYLTLAVTGPDLPAVTLSTSTPDPDPTLTVIADTVELHHDVVEPLQHVHLGLSGTASAAGSEVGLVADLHWYTAATPAAYGVSPLLLIPCAVTGTITVSGMGADRTITLDAPGYREHAWAGTDWWEMRWTAFTAHFDDGTDMNGIDARVPGLAPVSLGQVQSPGVAPVLLDVSRVLSGPDDDPDDETAPWIVAVEPGAFTLTFTPVADASARRPGPGGRDALLRRAWGTFTRNDGRTGVGWLETEAAPIGPGTPPRGLHSPPQLPPNL